MGYLKFSPNLFLETQELTFFQQMMRDAGFQRQLIANTANWGIVDSNGFADQFKITAGTYSGFFGVCGYLWGKGC